jgi:hypothetical protein
MSVKWMGAEGAGVDPGKAVRADGIAVVRSAERSTVGAATENFNGLPCVRSFANAAEI